MERKFQVGDMIVFENEDILKVVEIVEEYKLVNGDWNGGKDNCHVYSSYVCEVARIRIIPTGVLVAVPFNFESVFELHSRPEVAKGEWNAICKCGAPAFTSMFSVTCSKGCTGQY